MYRVYPRRNIERDANICALLRGGGVTQADIARDLGLSRERVRKIALGEGITAGRGKPAPHAPEVIQAARVLWEKGLSAQRIALCLTSKERPMSKCVISGIAHRNHFPRRPSPIAFASRVAAPEPW